MMRKKIVENRNKNLGDDKKKMKTRESSFGKAFLKLFCFAKAFTENTSWKKRFVEIAIVLCSVFLVATLPGIAADQNQETLGIYGNANEDDTIDMRDITFTARIICWLEEPTDLADANHDGEIDVGDMTQIGLIILGREKKLTIIDSNDRIVTLDMPIERIIALSTGGPAAPLCLLGVEDKLVGSNGMIAKSPSYPDLHDLPSVGYPGPDYEAIVELEPDLVMACTWAYGGEYGDVYMLESLGIKAVMFDFGTPATLPKTMQILGVMMGKEERAEEYIDFFHSTLSLVDDKVEGLEEKKTVYYEFAVRSSDYYKTGGGGSKFDEKIQRAGGINIFAHIPWPSFDADPEAVLEEDPNVVTIDAHATCSIYEMDDTIELEEFRAEIINTRPGWNNMTAVKNDDLYIFVHETFCSIHVPVGICYLAKTLYPDEFSDLDPEAIKNEYLEEFFPDREYLMEYQGPHVYPCKWCT